MSNAKFTPGPWEIRGREVGVSDKSDTQSYGMLNIIAALDTFDFRDQWEANAHLISAAPDLYEALEAVLEHFGPIAGDVVDDNQSRAEIAAADRAHAALRKARGEIIKGGSHE